MPSDKDHWERIYQTTDHQKLGWHEDSPRVSLQLFSRVNASPACSVIDVGCGASSLADNLLWHGYNKLTLVDYSPHALESIKSRLGEQRETPNYLSEDICRASFNQQFDIWHDRAVFHFLTNKTDRCHYLSVLLNSLNPGGHAIIATFSEDGPKTCAGLDIVRYDAQKMRAQLPPGLELIDSELSLHQTPNGENQQYRYFLIAND